MDMECELDDGSGGSLGMGQEGQLGGTLTDGNYLLQTSPLGDVPYWGLELPGGPGG